MYPVPYETIFKSELNPLLQLRFRDDYNNCAIEKKNDVMVASLYIPKEWNWVETDDPRPASREEFLSWPPGIKMENPHLLIFCETLQTRLSLGGHMSADMLRACTQQILLGYFFDDELEKLINKIGSDELFMAANECIINVLLKKQVEDLDKFSVDFPKEVKAFKTCIEGFESIRREAEKLMIPKMYKKWNFVTRKQVEIQKQELLAIKENSSDPTDDWQPMFDTRYISIGFNFMCGFIYGDDPEAVNMDLLNDPIITAVTYIMQKDNDLISYEKEVRSGLGVQTNSLYVGSKYKPMEEAIEQLVMDRNEYVKGLEIVYNKLPSHLRRLYKKTVFIVAGLNNSMMIGKGKYNRYLWLEENDENQKSIG